MTFGLGLCTLELVGHVPNNCLYYVKDLIIISAMSCCCHFSSVALGHNLGFTDNYQVFLGGGPAVGMADT